MLWRGFAEGVFVGVVRKLGMSFDGFWPRRMSFWDTKRSIMRWISGQMARLWDFSGNRKCFFHRKAGRDSRMGVGKLHLELGVV